MVKLWFVKAKYNSHHFSSDAEQGLVIVALYHQGVGRIAPYGNKALISQAS